MLSHAGQSTLRDSIGQQFAAGTFDNPLPVLGLLSQVQDALGSSANGPPQTAANSSGIEGQDNTIKSDPKSVATPSMVADRPQEPDGPHPPNRLLFAGKEMALEPIPWRLAAYMWERDRAATDDVCQYVWSERTDIVPEHALKVAQGKVNKSLTELGVDWRLGIKSGYVVKKKSRKSL